jgi:hypothetical protein
MSASAVRKFGWSLSVTDHVAPKGVPTTINKVWPFVAQRVIPVLDPGVIVNIPVGSPVTDAVNLSNSTACPFDIRR